MKISIGLVNCNSAVLFKSCLKSIYKHTQETPLEIIIVDNASSDNSRQIVCSEFPGVQLIESSVNLGFRCGNNLYHSRQLCYYRKPLGRLQSGRVQLCFHAMGKLQCL